MQESILIEPGSTAPKLGRKLRKVEWTREAECSALRAEFEERLADSSSLAFRVARSVLRNDADAEDIAQEALVKAFRNFEELRERSRFRSWLVRVSFRLALDRLRSGKRRGIREAQWIREQERTRPTECEASSEFQQHLELAIAELPEKLRLVLLLSAMDGHSLDEVAVLLAIPVGTVKSRLFFARKKLAEKLRCFAQPITNR
jgi:RNA polymerase sigma-70 factor (ECF subfamily)